MDNISCPHCGKKYTVPTSSDGRRTQCRVCGHYFRVQLLRNEPFAKPSLLIDEETSSLVAVIEERKEAEDRLTQINSPFPVRNTPAGRKERTLRPWSVITGLVLVAGLTTLVITFYHEESAKESPGRSVVMEKQSVVKLTGDQSIPKKRDSSDSTDAATDQETAKEKLRLALESWQFGDDKESFKKMHPEIVTFSNLGAVRDYQPYTPKLQRFEIISGRRTKKIKYPTLIVYEFNVIHTFESKAGMEIKKSHVYEVCTEKGKEWDIFSKLE